MGKLSFVQVDHNLFSPKFISIQNCVEQPFDSQAVFVTKNTTFMEEFAFNIRDYTADLEVRIGMYIKRLYFRS